MLENIKVKSDFPVIKAFFSGIKSYGNLENFIKAVVDFIQLLNWISKKISATSDMMAIGGIVGVMDENEVLADMNEFDILTSEYYHELKISVSENGNSVATLLHLGLDNELSKDQFSVMILLLREVKKYIIKRKEE